MVCTRCKMVVKSEFQKLGLNPISVELGEIGIQENNIEAALYAIKMNPKLKEIIMITN